MGGRATEMDQIIKIAKKKNIKVIEDAAQAFGSKYKKKILVQFLKLVVFRYPWLKQ